MKKVMKTMDGNTAAAYVSYALLMWQPLFNYPSSTMAELVDEWSANGKRIFLVKRLHTEMQSEVGAAGLSGSSSRCSDHNIQHPKACF